MASDFHFRAVMDGLLGSGQILAAAEDCVPGFADRRIHLLAHVGTRGVVAGYIVLGGLRVVTGGGGREI